ncbi:MAG: nitric oxide-sensing protein NosP [Magnetospiraceae bacterium]
MGAPHAQSRIRQAVTSLADPQAAVKDLHDQLVQADMSMVVLFCSPDYPLCDLKSALAETFEGAKVVGCTTAGELSQNGYSEGSISGLSLARPDFNAASARITDLSHYTLTSGREIVSSLLEELKAQGVDPTPENTFAFLMIDGLCRCEELLVSTLYPALGGIQLFGGSAGDGMHFDRTFVLHDGEFHPESAVLTLVSTEHPFRIFNSQHFRSTGRKMVVTEADPANRIVTEINAEPAAHEYARLVGLEDAALTPMVFANHPVVVRVGGEDHVRSIQKVNADGSLTFFCAIDCGVVLTVAEGVDITQSVQNLMDNLNESIGHPDLIIGCDCVLRSLELERKQLRRELAPLFESNNFIGFNTYGEQYNSMHVNQTLTGVAIGRRTAISAE